MTTKTALNPWEKVEPGSSYRELIATRSTSDNEVSCSIYDVHTAPGQFFEAWFTHKLSAGSIAGAASLHLTYEQAKEWCDAKLEEFLKDEESDLEDEGSASEDTVDEDGEGATT